MSLSTKSYLCFGLVVVFSFVVEFACGFARLPEFYFVNVVVFSATPTPTKEMVCLSGF